MEESSVLLYKRCTPWQWLLLTASLLSLWHLPTTEQFPSDSVPALVAEGDNVLLPVRSLPAKIKSITWYKEIRNETKEIAVYTLRNNLNKPGPAHSGRETIYRNGTLLIEKVNTKDTGFYTLRTRNRHGKIVSTSVKYLDVIPLLWKCGRLATSPKATIELVPPSVAEGRSVLFLVRNPPELTTSYIWFKGKIDLKNLVGIQNVRDRKPTLWGPAYRGRQIMNNDGSLLIQRVTRKDSGLYTLRFLRTDAKTDDVQVQLHVDSSPFGLCNSLASSQIVIHPVPPHASKGQYVLLQAHNLPEDLLAFTWYKSNYRIPVLKIIEYIRDSKSITWAPEYRGKGTVFSNGSLLLQDITEKDAGMYTLEVLNKNVEFERAYLELYIKKNVTQPILQITDNTLTGGTSVIFNCISPDTDVSIHWIFKKETLQLKERMTFSPTKCGLRIDPVSREDAGEYKCEVSNGFSLKTSLPVSWP